jgi:dTDP-glucose pyrophosphorylase
MQAVILAAGKGTRMGTLSDTTPKPMLVIAGKTLLQHKIDRLPDAIDEVIIVVGHKKESIISFFGTRYANKTIRYVTQEGQGTADALWLTRPFITGPFLSMMGDDVYSADAMKAVMDYPWAMTVAVAKSGRSTIDIRTTPEGYFYDAVVDDIGHGGDVHIDTCLYKFGPELFDASFVKVPNKEEWGLPHTLFNFLKTSGTPMKVLRDDGWIKVNTPEDLAHAETSLALEVLYPSIVTMGSHPMTRDLEQLLESARTVYHKQDRIICPYFTVPVRLGSDGFTHLRFKKNRLPRTVPEQIHKLRLVKSALDVIRRSGTIQDHRLRLERSGKSGRDGFTKTKPVEYWALHAIRGDRHESTIVVVLRRVEYGSIEFWSIFSHKRRVFNIDSDP